MPTTGKFRLPTGIGGRAAAPLVGHAIQRWNWTIGFLALAALTAILPLTLLVAYPILNAVHHDVGAHQS